MATTMTRPSRKTNGAGIGLRLPHIAEVVATGPSIGWLEIHPENFLANPHASELLVDLSHRYPISVHTVGVSIGSATGIDGAHLNRVRELIDKIDPVLVSGHLAWSTHETPSTSRASVGIPKGFRLPARRWHRLTWENEKDQDRAGVPSGSVL